MFISNYYKKQQRNQTNTQNKKLNSAMKKIDRRDLKNVLKSGMSAHFCESYTQDPTFSITLAVSARNY